MDEATVELKVPAAIIERAEAIASDSGRSAESVIVDGLSLLFSTDSEFVGNPDALAGISDEHLWMLVQQRLTPKQDARMRELADRGNGGDLSDAERTELEAWVARVDNQMLLRSRALLLLNRRGHDIDDYFATAV